LNGGLTWLNSTPVKLADFRGRVVLLDFFEYSCVNCLRTLPYVQEWQRRYSDKGLVIIGVHSPQYGFSMDPQNVFLAVKRLGLTYPVVVDSNLIIAQAYQNRFWPRKVIIDQDGLIQFDHTGEGAYEEMEKMIQALLRRGNPQVTLPPIMELLQPTDRLGAVCYPITPELYLGKERGKLANPAEATTNSWSFYTLPDQLEPDRIYAAGAWQNHSEYFRHARDTEEIEDFIALLYRAVEVNVVMKPEDVYWFQIFVKQDGAWLRKAVAGSDVLFDEEGRSYVKVDAARMYNLIANQPYGAHDLRLYPLSRGLSVYSFSFGTCLVPADVKRLEQGKNGKR